MNDKPKFQLPDADLDESVEFEAPVEKKVVSKRINQNRRPVQQEDERALKKTEFTDDGTPKLYIKDFDDLDIKGEMRKLLPKSTMEVEKREKRVRRSSN